MHVILNGKTNFPFFFATFLSPFLIIFVSLIWGEDWQENWLVSLLGECWALNKWIGETHIFCYFYYRKHFIYFLGYIPPLGTLWWKELVTTARRAM